MGHDIKISIIIPVYKVEPYIVRCIESVLRQTYRNLEIIIVDDCTPDRSMDIAQSVINDYLDVNVNDNLNDNLRFVYLRHEHNRGLSAARNTGTDAATGDYVFFMDSDDELPDNAIEILCQEVRKRPGIEMVQGLRKYITPHKLNNSQTVFSLYVEDNNWIRYHYYYEPKRIISTTAWNKLILKSFVTTNHLYFKEGLIHEDELWMFEVVKVLRKYAVISNLTYLHYSTEGSIMNTEDALQRSFHWNIILTEILKKLDNPYKKLQLLTYTLFAKKMLVANDCSNKWLLIRYAFCHLKMHSYKVAFYLLLYSWFYPHCGWRLENALSFQLAKYSDFQKPYQGKQ